MHYKKVPKNGSTVKAIDWDVVGSLLRRKGSVYVLSEASIRAKILSTYHDDLCARHYRFYKTFELIRRKYF